MVSKSKRKREFLEAHPYCCFCGGDIEAEEEDHIPSRVIFENRQWPKGYVFPACIKCNRNTRYDEQVVAVLSRAYPNPTKKSEKEQIRKLFESISKNNPELYRELEANEEEKLEACRKHGLILTSHNIDKLPLLKASGKLTDRAICNFGRKLMLALYYKHSGKILSLTSGIRLYWYTNLQRNNIPAELFSSLDQFPELIRNNIDLTDQFGYQYKMAGDHSAALFSTYFRQSFAIIGIIDTDRKELEPMPDTKTYGPYNHR